MWRYPFGSGGKRVTTVWRRPSRRSAATISRMKSPRSGEDGVWMLTRPRIAQGSAGAPAQPCAILGRVSIQTPSSPERGDFIRETVAADLREGRHQTVVTRFPPEPNGYLHIGHAKAICLNFGIAGEFGGRCHLRFDDTNPTKEEQEYIDSIEADVRWLGFDWGEHLYFASDYFEQLYEWAVDLIRAGKAYVDDLTADEIREHRGTFTEPGRESPWRDRPADENLDLFERMRAGELAGCARASTWPPRTSTCATLCCTGSSTRSIRGRATRGASTPPTTSPTGNPTRSRASRTPSAPWSSRTTGRSTTGSSTTCRCRRDPTSTSSRGSSSRTPSCPSVCSCASSTMGTCAAGTTRGCPLCPAFATPTIVTKSRMPSAGK